MPDKPKLGKDTAIAMLQIMGNLACAEGCAVSTEFGEKAYRLLHKHFDMPWALDPEPIDEEYVLALGFQRTGEGTDGPRRYEHRLPDGRLIALNRMSDGNWRLWRRWGQVVEATPTRGGLAGLLTLLHAFPDGPAAVSKQPSTPAPEPADRFVRDIILLLAAVMVLMVIPALLLTLLAPPRG